MKKTLSLFVMLLTCMTMMAETVKIDFTKAPDEQSPNKVVWKVGDLTFTVDKGKSTHNVNEKVDQNGIVLNKDQVMTISSTNGTSIQKATFRDSPIEPGPTPPTFSTLQNCKAEYGWDTVLIAEAEGCTSMGGTLSGYSHIIWVDIETGGTSDNNFVGKQFYLYNEATGLFLSANNQWTVEASLTEDANLFTIEETEKGPAYAFYNLDIDAYQYRDDQENYHRLQRLGTFPYLSFYIVGTAYYSAWITDSNGYDDMVDGIWDINRVDDDFVTVSLISCRLYEEEGMHPRRYLTASTEKGEVRGYKMMLSETMTDRALFRVIYPDDLLAFMQEKAKTEKISYNFLIQNPDMVTRLRSDKWMLDGEPFDPRDFKGRNNSYTYFDSRKEHFKLEQIIENLPAGKYEMTAQAFYLKADKNLPVTSAPIVYLNDEVQEIREASPESKNEYGYFEPEDMFTKGLEYITPIRFTSYGEPVKIGFSIEDNPSLEIYFDNIRITNVMDEDDDPSVVDSKALRTLYVDFLNYRSEVEVHHPTAFYLFLAVEKHVDEVAEHFENQQECDDLYVWLLEKFNIIREMAGDGPYNDSEYTARGFQTEELDKLLHSVEKYYDSIVTSHADQAVILNNALNDAKTRIADIASQNDVETIYNALLAVYNNVKEACENSGDNEDNDKYGTPMAPIKPDLSQYTHKMMVLGAPWGMQDLAMAILRDSEGQVVQKMTMRIDVNNLSAHLTDSVRTYAYEDNKMIEYLAVPYYDQDDVLHMEQMNRTTTSFFKLANGHREVVEGAWFEDGEYVGGNGREEYIFDSEGRKVSYKKYYGDELEADLTYTYDENGGCLGRGLYDGMQNNSTYIRYDANGNLRGRTEWGTYYEYFYDNQNHYQGYKYYDGYNFDDNTYRSVNDNNYFEIVETYADGSAKKMKRKGDGQVRTFSREGNVETQKNTGNGTEVVITRTFDDQGRIVAKTSTEKDFKASYIYSDLAANQVLGAVNTFDEDLHTNYQEQTNWTYSNPLMVTSYDYTFWGFNEKAFTTYNIVPLSVLPAQTTEEGVAISLGGEGDQVVLSNDGEIYLLDKGGKKRYSVSVAGITVSSEGGKIVVTGWTPVSPEASAKGMHKAPETIDLSTNEYDIYIPEDVITINGKPLNEVYLPITLDDSEANGIVEVKYDNRNTTTDGRIYNLQGVQVKNPVHGQIVIINGKKVLVK